MYVPTLDQMLQNLSDNVPGLLQMVAGISFTMGVVFMVQALYTFKQYGDMRTMTSSSTDFRGPSTMFLLGAMLVWLPSSIDVGVATFWGSSNLLQYQPPDAMSAQARMLKIVLNVMTLIGTISFIRGIALLSKLGSRQGSQPGQFGKGISHVVAGILAINMYASWDMLLNTFGISLQ